MFNSWAINSPGVPDSRHIPQPGSAAAGVPPSSALFWTCCICAVPSCSAVVVIAFFYLFFFLFLTVLYFPCRIIGRMQGRVHPWMSPQLIWGEQFLKVPLDCSEGVLSPFLPRNQFWEALTEHMDRNNSKIFVMILLCVKMSYTHALDITTVFWENGQ